MTSQVSTSPAAGSIKVACIQMQPVFGNVAANVAHSLELTIVRHPKAPTS